MEITLEPLAFRHLKESMSIDQLTNSILQFDKGYCIGVYFVDINFRFQKNYTQKTNNLYGSHFIF